MKGRKAVTITGETFPFHDELRRRGWRWDGAERMWWMPKSRYRRKMHAWILSLPGVAINGGMRVFDSGSNM